MVDLIIILILLFGGFIGYKQGFTKSLVNFIGIILILIISFILKNPIAEFMMLNLPFFDFGGLIKGVSVLNILFYEVIAFGICFSILFLILKIVMVFTNVFEKILSMTFVLGFLDSVLGFIFGILKNYIIVFVILFVLSLPNFSFNKIISDSKLREIIIENTPILSGCVADANDVFEEFLSLKEKYENDSVSDKFNYETLDLFLKYEIVKPKTVEKLISSGKLHIDDSKNLIEKYEK